MTDTTTRAEPQFPIFRSCPYTPPEGARGFPTCLASRSMVYASPFVDCRAGAYSATRRGRHPLHLRGVPGVDTLGDPS